MTLRNVTYFGSQVLATVVIDDSSGAPKWWNTNSGEFEAYSAGNIANYGIATTQNAGCNYSWQIPSNANFVQTVAGSPYRSLTFPIAGENLATGDIAVSCYEDAFAWSGSIVYTEQNVGAVANLDASGLSATLASSGVFSAAALANAPDSPVVITPLQSTVSNPLQVTPGLPISISQYSGPELQWTITDSAGDPVDLSGATVRISFCISPNFAQPAFSYDTVSGAVTIGGTGNNVVSVQMNYGGRTDTAQAQTYEYFMWDVATLSTPLATGQLIVTPASNPAPSTSYICNQNGGTGAGSAPMTIGGLAITSGQLTIVGPAGPIEGCAITAYAAADVAQVNPLGTQTTDASGSWTTGIALPSSSAGYQIVAVAAGFQPMQLGIVVVP